MFSAILRLLVNNFYLRSREVNSDVVITWTKCACLPAININELTRHRKCILSGTCWIITIVVTIVCESLKLNFSSSFTRNGNSNCLRIGNKSARKHEGNWINPSNHMDDDDDECVDVLLKQVIMWALSTFRKVKKGSFSVTMWLINKLRLMALSRLR